MTTINSVTGRSIFVLAAFSLVACSDSSAPTAPVAASIQVANDSAAKPSSTMVPPSSLSFSYTVFDIDQISLVSADSRAKATGSISWSEDSRNTLIKRGTYRTGSKVAAILPVPCIWAKITFTTLTGVATVGITSGISGTISGVEYTAGEFASCRKSGQTYPPPLDLSGIAYAKTGLIWTHITIGTSQKLSDGMRWSATERNDMGGA
jgi:hypothetical protein